ncbi:MAG: Crp/Fnr family transcriptional regulator [Gemmatimonadetes bacterium]|nr:Crp/Fnr family transcriptional regulator [Gemmatimonadota bacterium]
MSSQTPFPDLWADPQLRALGHEALELLRPHLHLRRFRAGELLWREGDAEGMLVALRSGRVKIYRLLPNAREVTLLLFGPGDVFGFLPLLDGQNYPAYAQALEEAEADVMARTTLLRVLRAEPELAVTLLGLLGGRLRAAFDLIRSMSTPGAQTRVAQALLALLPPEAALTGNPVVVRLPVSAHEFAGALGLVPETLSRALTGLVRDGVLQRAGTGRYRILDVAVLRRTGEAAGS